MTWGNLVILALFIKQVTFFTCTQSLYSALHISVDHDMFGRKKKNKSKPDIWPYLCGKLDVLLSGHPNISALSRSQV